MSLLGLYISFLPQKITKVDGDICGALYTLKAKLYEYISCR